MLARLREKLRLPTERGEVDEDDPETTIRRARTIQEKPFLKKLYLEFYREMERACAGAPDGLRVEIGSGGGCIKEVMPDVLTSDVLELPGVDRHFSALDMPLEDASVSVFFMMHVFHHIGDALVLLKEMDRCLLPGGRVVMVEPSGTPLAGIMYQHVHDEPFDRRAGWALSGNGPLSGANAALPWIVFQRDQSRLSEDLPNLRVVSYRNHRPISPALSGGVSYVQFAPAWSYGAIRAFERILTPINSVIGMISTVVLEKPRQ